MTAPLTAPPFPDDHLAPCGPAAAKYAAHWTLGDIPPSGALDPEAIARDFLLGIRTPSYEEHTNRIFPGLLGSERELLTRLMERPSVPDAALRSLGLDASTLAQATRGKLRGVVGRHPMLAALYLLFVAHARMSGVHLKIAKKYLFAPQRQREAAGPGDPSVVSNRLGTTGMDERYLEELTRARHRHVLACLHTLGGAELDSLAGLGQVRAASPGPGSLVRFTGLGTGHGRLGEWPPARLRAVLHHRGTGGHRPRPVDRLRGGQGGRRGGAAPVRTGRRHHGQGRPACGVDGRHPHARRQRRRPAAGPARPSWWWRMTTPSAK